MDLSSHKIMTGKERDEGSGSGLLLRLLSSSDSKVKVKQSLYRPGLDQSVPGS